MQIIIAEAATTLGLEGEKEEGGSYQNIDTWRRSPQVWDPDL